MTYFQTSSLAQFCSASILSFGDVKALDRVRRAVSLKSIDGAFNHGAVGNIFTPFVFGEDFYAEDEEALAEVA